MKKKTFNKKKFVAKKTPKVIEANVDAATRWLNMTDVGQSRNMAHSVGFSSSLTS